jgi:phosphinothricin acetyltransferase
MESGNMFTIRPATLNDLEDITNIYNEAIQKTVATFDTETKTIEEQKIWFKEHGPNNPLIVAVQDENIIGWAALSKYSTRCAYSNTAEISLYIKEEYQGIGFGRKLINAIIKEGEKTNIHVVIARITEGNVVSVHLHKSVGFEHIGTMKEVGQKFGRLLDVHLMQKIY